MSAGSDFVGPSLENSAAIEIGREVVFPGRKPLREIALQAAKDLSRPARHAAQRSFERACLSLAIRRLYALEPGQVPDSSLIALLHRGWGNTGWSAGSGTLEASARLAVESEGPILECGSGITTLMMGILAGRRGVELWTLENHAGWHARVQAELVRYGIDNVHYELAPLVDFGEFSWYDTSQAQLPSNFRGVLCDGPPESSTRGGRFGLFPVMRDRMAPGCSVLVDDAQRPSELAIVHSWSRQYELEVAFSGESKVLGILSLAA